MPKLSVIIPARDEEFLQLTIDEVLTKSRGDTEVIVVLDGYWPEEGIPQNERVNIIHHNVSVGQRAAINEAARISTAEYIMKLDAHCTLAPGFDVVLMESAEELGRDVTQVPTQYNLHVYDWVCDKCGNRWYQSPFPKYCRKEYDDRAKEINPNCDSQSFHREIMWRKRERKVTFSWKFDPELHFQYWGDWGKRHPKEEFPYLETMSILGACFFMRRDRYWELGGSDEAHGSWGQQGTEIACKSWLSGGRVICNRKTWYAHFFRTGDIGFPYPLSGDEQEAARNYSKDFWRNNRFEKQIHPLSWLVERFWPVESWTEEDLLKLKSFENKNTNHGDR